MPKTYDIIIIGAGPAGLTAAIYGVRANRKVLIISSNEISSNDYVLVARVSLVTKA